MRNLNGDLSHEAHALLDVMVKVPAASPSAIRPIPIGKTATHVVVIDGIRYAGFGSHMEARLAAEAWRHGWAAVKGLSIEVERL